jgi:hypothetical protein
VLLCQIGKAVAAALVPFSKLFPSIYEITSLPAFHGV